MPRSGALWGVVRGRFGLYNYVMTAVSAVPSTGLGKAVIDFCLSSFQKLCPDILCFWPNVHRSVGNGLLFSD